MKRIILQITLVLLIVLSSCNNNTVNNKLIVGNWSGAEWLINGQPSDRKVQTTAFSFDDKGGYSFDYDGTKQEGTYKVENDMLFTTPKGEAEIMVKITKLTKDSLVFDMNRGGQPETLTLIKK
ncbi:MAG: lipocalin family protein [Ferruginibacter sp.]